MKALARQMITLVALVALVVAGLAGIAQLQFTSFVSSSVEERLEIIASTTALDFATATDLGLSIEGVANGEAILTRARHHDPLIRSIRVFDLDGTIVHAVGDVEGPTIEGDTLEGFRLARVGITEPEWRVENDERIGSGALIVGGFGQTVGGVVVTYPKTEMAALSDDMAGKLTVDGLAVGGALAVLIVFVLVAARARARREEPE